MKPEDRRDQILAAAAACFTTEGFHQTSIDAIARAAGISPGLIYRHFKGKEDLIAAMTARVQTESRRQFAQALEYPSILAALEFLFDASIQRSEWKASVPLLMQIMAESFRNPQIAEILQKDNQYFCDFFALLIRQAQSRGQIDPGLPPEESAYMLMAFTNGFIYQLAQDNAWEKLTDPVTVRLFKQVYTRFLKVKEAEHF